MTTRELFGYMLMGVAVILLILWSIFVVPGNEAAEAGEYRLKKGELIVLSIGKPTQMPTKYKNRKAIFTYTGRLRSYYTIDYQSCDGRRGTGTQSYCAPHKIFLHQDAPIEIDYYIFRIKACIDDCDTLLPLEFIQYK